MGVGTLSEARTELHLRNLFAKLFRREFIKNKPRTRRPVRLTTASLVSGQPAGRYFDWEFRPSFLLSFVGKHKPHASTTELIKLTGAASS